MKLIDRKNLNYSGIYKITNILNNHCYIGQAKNIKLRIYYHLNSTYNSKKKDYNYPLHQAIRKYGVDNFNLEVLEKCSEDELNKKEIFYIQKYHSCKLDSKYVGGYNLTSGGKQHIRHIKLTREQVIQIYELLVNTQLSFKDIAFRFNVSSDLVYRINIGRV